MKITMFGPLPPIKAISPYCSHLARELSKEIDLQIITYKMIKPETFYSGGTIDQSIKLIEIGNTEIKRSLVWYNPLSWIKSALAVKGEIVHIQHWAIYSSFVYCFILPILKIMGKKIVLTIHNITPHVNVKLIVFTDNIINKIIFPFADSYIVHNQRNKEKLLKLYKINEKKISIITHGVLKPEKIRNTTKTEAREILGLSNNKKILLFFGYIWEYKGLDTILQSLILIKNEIPDIALLIAGEPVKSLDNWDRYQTIIDKYDLHKYIIKNLTYIPDSKIELYFSAADLVVLPYKEPFQTHGGVGALALSFKKAMVVTDIGGLPEYVKDKKVISYPNDVNGLFKNIIRVLKDEKLLKKLSRDSESLAKELSWELISKKTIEVYKNL